MVYKYNQGVIKQRLTIASVLVIAGLFAIFSSFGVFSTADAAKPNKAVTIQSGELVNSAGETLTTGFDQWGYNYQAHLFNGKYCDAYRDATWCQDYKDVNLSMKWNDAWLANTDADDDFLLDRHHGYPSYQGSGAWLTNHQSGVNEDGTHWTYFTKIVAAPADATKTNGIWFAADGTEIGPVIWGEFATIQEVSNDPAADQHGVQYVSPQRTGLGNW